jgi:hypothetical protein
MMKSAFLAIAVASLCAAAEATSKTEILRFHVNYPSGLSLGEGHLTSTRTADGWDLAIHVEAAIPAFAVIESAKSHATADLCSLQFEKLAVRGKRKVEEVTTFDTAAMKATRKTKGGGGSSESTTGACAKDAVAFVRFVRNELIAGRVPAPQTVYYGAGYQTRLHYAGRHRLQREGESLEVDKLNATVKGPGSEFTVELMFERDPARTPVRAVIPVKPGNLTVEFFR